MRRLLIAIALVCGGTALGVPWLPAVPVETPPLNPRLEALPPNTWTRLHELEPDDPQAFLRPWHGGAVLDTKRCRLVLFGSDTHGTQFDNRVHVFDVVSETWSAPYPADDWKTYAVSEQGFPVAGEEGDHPWAMHTLGAIAYHPERDEMVVAASPLHNVPDYFEGVAERPRIKPLYDHMRALWPAFETHPVWIWSFARAAWTPHAGEGKGFSFWALVYDSKRGKLVGYRNAIYETADPRKGWARVADVSDEEGPVFGSVGTAVFHHKAAVLLGFGGFVRDKVNNVVGVYDPTAGTVRAMPTPGLRPTATRYPTLSYHPTINRVVHLGDAPARGDDEPRRAATWLYDYENDAWTTVPGVELPFALRESTRSYNYTLTYDPRHDVLLLATREGRGGTRGTAVWALRLEP